MKSHHPDSDLITKVDCEWIDKVNSEWIHKMLINPEFAHADPMDDADNLIPGSRSARVQSRLKPREPVQILANLNRLRHPKPSVVVARPRSVARRVTERLAFAAAALGVGAAVWMTQGLQGASVSARGTTTAPQSAALNITALNSAEPAWLSPEILFAAAIPPSLTRRTEAPAFMPRPGR